MKANHEGRTDVRRRLTRYLGRRRRRRQSQQLGIRIEGSPATDSTFAVSRLAVDTSVPVVLLPLDSQHLRPRAEMLRLLAEPATRPAPPDPAAAATGAGAPRVIIDDGQVLSSTSSAALRALRDLQDAGPACRTPIVDATVLPIAIRGHGARWTPEPGRDHDDAGSRGSR
jgi:hypothetical protein